MASPAQIAANQLNSRKSTGPTTPQGRRGMANDRKYQASASGRWDGPSGVGWHGAQPDISEDGGREVREPDCWELGAHSSFGSGDRQDDRLKRADVIDPDGVEQHGDKLNGTGEIGENAPNEASFDETMSIVEAQESIHVTPNSAALSGLDNGAAQPREDKTPEHGEVPASAPASGNPEPPTPGSSDRAYRGSLPVTVSNREMQLQLEEERQAVLRMVE